MFFEWKHNTAEDRVMIMRALIGTPMGVRQLAKALQMAPSAVIALQAEMEEQGLLQAVPRSGKARGRPKRLLVPTPLGRDYLLAFSILESKKLKASPADLRRATRDARHAAKLAASGRSISGLFLEMNEIALSHS
jgi:predicted ArsR family transcriptional regulator